jgi:P27 family predicted phage terminase small subunit
MALTVGNSGPIAAPAWLAAGARAVWEGLAPELQAKGVLTSWDVDAFAVFCEAVVHHREACRAVDQASVIQETRFGQTKHPALQIVRDQAQIVRAYAQEFGLTPSARSEIDLPVEAPLEALRLLS